MDTKKSYQYLDNGIWVDCQLYGIFQHSKMVTSQLSNASIQGIVSYPVAVIGCNGRIREVDIELLRFVMELS